MEKTFGKISADERRRALEGEQIDHHLTDDYDPIAELDASVAEDLLKSELLRKDISEIGAFTPAELATYEAYWDTVSVERTLANSNFRKGKAEEKVQTVLESKKIGLSIDIIATITKLTPDEVSEILKQHDNDI
jgi:hypothetical protein